MATRSKSALYKAVGDPDGVRNRILAAAKSEFAAHGLRGVSVRDIATGAKTTAAMINYYFGGKQGLYHEVVEQALGPLLVRLGGVMQEASGEDDLAPRLSVLYFDFLSKERELQQLLLREVLDSSEVLPAIVLRHLVPLRTMFEGRFGTGDAAFQAAVSLFSSVAGYFLYAPLLAELTGQDPLSAKSLRQRRKHVVELADHLSTWYKDHK